MFFQLTTVILFCFSQPTCGCQLFSACVILNSTQIHKRYLLLGCWHVFWACSIVLKVDLWIDPLFLPSSRHGSIRTPWPSCRWPTRLPLNPRSAHCYAWLQYPMHLPQSCPGRVVCVCESQSLHPQQGFCFCDELVEYWETNEMHDLLSLFYLMMKWVPQYFTMSSRFTVSVCLSRDVACFSVWFSDPVRGKPGNSNCTSSSTD